MDYLSPYINTLQKSLPFHKLPNSIDLILEGGAMNGGYEIGVLTYLRNLEKDNKIKINRISGVSCGALNAALYLCNQIDLADQLFSKLTSGLHNTGSFSFLSECIDNFLKSIPDDNITTLNDRLFITYINLNSQERITQSKFSDKSDLKNALLRSAHLPFLIDGKATCQEKYFDGGIPFVFPKISNHNSTNHKTLYIQLLSFDLLKETLSSKSQEDVTSRAVDGIQLIDDFLKRLQPNKIASFTEDWSKIRILQQLSISILWSSFVYLFALLKHYYDQLPSQYRQHYILQKIRFIFKSIYQEYLCRLIN